MDLGEVAEFDLVRSTGEPLRRSDLKGRIWVVDFIFTRCAGPCPRMTDQMRTLTRQLSGDDVRFLSISVDPEYDTPEVLADYARRFEADPERWVFATGDKARIYQLSAESFYLPVEDPTDTDQIIHSTRFVVLDPEGLCLRLHGGGGANVERVNLIR